jgi:hypothetical protein
VLQDIDEYAVFDDILVEFLNIVEKNFIALGYDVKHIKKGKVIE